jgi:hypothetical protein
LSQLLGVTKRKISKRGAFVHLGHTPFLERERERVGREWEKERELTRSSRPSLELKEGKNLLNSCQRFFEMLIAFEV